jgi:aspartate aminotransferase
MGAPQFIASACAKIQGQFTSGANSFSQHAAAYAIEADMSATHAMREAFLQRRDLVTGLLGQIEGFKVNQPTGAFYSFPDISYFFGKSDGETTVNNADDFCEYLLAKAHVATVSGGAFGAESCFRISYATSEALLREAIARIAEAVGKLR